MRRSKHGFGIRELALGPVLLFIWGGGAPALAASSDVNASVYSKVADAEARIGRALSARDGKAIATVAGDLGHLIDDAIARRQDGNAATACDMAAHSLAYVAVSLAEGLADKGDARGVLIEDARAAAADFRGDMQACEKLLRRKPGAHTSVEKALKAL